MTELTQKQKDNRAYHAKHAEKIRAQKREAYQKTSDSKPAKPKKERKKMKITYRNPDKPPDPTHTKSPITENDRERLKTRRRIEDWLLAKELGIESF